MRLINVRSSKARLSIIGTIFMYYCDLLLVSTVCLQLSYQFFIVVAAIATILDIVPVTS